MIYYRIYNFSLNVVSDCEAGYFRAADDLSPECTMCNKNYYQNMTNQTSCIPCPSTNRTITLQQGSVNESQCGNHRTKTPDILQEVGPLSGSGYTNSGGDMKYSEVFYIPAEYFLSPPELVHPKPENCPTPRRISGALVL